MPKKRTVLVLRVPRGDAHDAIATNTLGGPPRRPDGVRRHDSIFRGLLGTAPMLCKQAGTKEVVSVNIEVHDWLESPEKFPSWVHPQ